MQHGQHTRRPAGSPTAAKPAEKAARTAPPRPGRRKAASARKANSAEQNFRQEIARRGGDTWNLSAETDPLALALPLVLGLLAAVGIGLFVWIRTAKPFANTNETAGSFSLAVETYVHSGPESPLPESESAAGAEGEAAAPASSVSASAALAEASALPVASASPSPSAAASATPTAAPAASAAADTQQALLTAAAASDNKETTYSSAEDYFGSDDVFLTFYDILEDVEGPVPTTPIVDGSDKIASSGGSAPAVSAGPPASGSGSSSCVKAYNSWSTELKKYAYDTAKAYGISYELVLAVIYHESKFNAAATHLNANGTTDWGLMQINDVCFPLLQKQLGLSSMNDLLDPYKAIQAGCAILAYHYGATGSESDALLRYQVGVGNYFYYKETGTCPKAYTNTLALRDTFVSAGI